MEEDEFDDDSFGSDFDEEEVIARVDKRKEINRHITTIEKSQPRQSTLDGGVLTVDKDGNKITYRTIQNIVSFGPTHHSLNHENLGTFVYPTNYEVRDYQYDIVSKALLKNILCALPTGLGKTFIASTVMLNFYRWTKTAKIVFMAPTRPLVAQQIRACYEISGIPSHDTAILLDKTKKNRAEIWEAKRVFFATPQVVENDLKNGFVNPKDIVCLVIDEAHRAKGNYAYNNVVKFLNRFTSSFRILALTATPASDVDGVQELVSNLTISKVEIRTEESLDTAKYMKKKSIVRVTSPPNDDVLGIVELLATAIKPTLDKCLEFKIYDITDPYKVNAFLAMEASQRIVRDPKISEGLKWMYFFLLQLLSVAGQGFRRLHIYGIKSFYSYFKEKYEEFTAKWETKKSTNKYAADFYYRPEVKKLLTICETLIDRDNKLNLIGKGTSGLFSHSKFEVMVQELSKFFTTAKNDARVIIFTEFRESALEIVKVIDTYNTNNKDNLSVELKPHVFIGQSREREKFDDIAYRRKAAPKKKGRKKASEVALENEKKQVELKEKLQKKKDVQLKRNESLVGSSETAQEQGMKQEQQKELIKQFKQGIYNIIVATSIGEEGLDIGEVDLIICFDSTSSPIKNIQRMGRTGRKRDGKVVLLFSSNEESKFDKAMGGYEFIQKQIQSGLLLKYENSDRILPKDCQPKPEMKYIEIPEENDELINIAEEDSDNFLKIATQITTKKKSGKLKTKKDTKQTKLTKKFFMPDNVVTGFQSASKMVDKSFSEDISDANVSYISVSEIKKQKSSGETVSQSIVIEDLEDDELDALLSDVKQKSNVIHNDLSGENALTSLKKEDLSAPNENDTLTRPADTVLEKDDTFNSSPSHDGKMIDYSFSTQQSQRKRVFSQRRSMNVVESLHRQAKQKGKPLTSKKNKSTGVLDDERPSKRLKSITDQIEEHNKNTLVDPSKFGPTDGYLTLQDLEDFYNSCQTCEIEMDDGFFEPKATKDVCCVVGHSSKMFRFLEFMKESI